MKSTKNLAALVCATLLSTSAFAGTKPSIPSTTTVDTDTVFASYQTATTEKGGAPLPALLAAPHGAGTGGGTFDEDEPNGTDSSASYARDIPFTARGTVEPGDLDDFSVDVEAGQVLQARAISALLNSPLDPKLYAYYLNGQSQVFLAQNDDANGLDSFVEFTVPVTGRIYFEVNSAIPGQGGQDYAYLLWVIPVGGSFLLEAEPNDEAGQADQVGLPALYLTTINAPGDVDWVQFQANAGDQLVVDVNAREFNLPTDSLVELYDNAGHKLLRNDDGEPGDVDSAFNIKLPATGVYNLRLSDFRPEAGSAQTGMFVHISVQDGAASPTVTNIKRNPGGLLKKIIGSGFATALTAEVDTFAVATVPVPSKPGVRKVKPAVQVQAGSVVTVVNGDGRRSNPFVLP